MAGKLTDIPTGELLKKFGAGKHKPGSGSAVALQGWLSAQLLRTVINLTDEPRRRGIYSRHLKTLLKIKEKIDSHIAPSLESLFQKDSEEFDRVIDLRERRDKEKDPVKKRVLNLEAQEALKVATQIPLDIAQLCLELANDARYIFDFGFQSARGDSGAALNMALSAVAGSLTIIELNFSSLPLDQQTEKMLERQSKIKSEYLKLRQKAPETLSVLENESNEWRQFLQSIAIFRDGNLSESVKTDIDIEKIVSNLQNTVWTYRHKIWKNDSMQDRFKVLDPGLILQKVMEYSYSESDTLGLHEHNGEFFEIAGLIDKNKKLVQVSKKFSRETRTFTAAHELGHAILHKQTILHRDRPLDGSTRIIRNQDEMQADKFAACFLMPAKLVTEAFFEIFEMKKFSMNETTALGLRLASLQELKSKCPNARSLARLVASTDYYAGKTVNSLSKIFKVSPEAMAIRLEELNLIEF